MKPGEWRALGRNRKMFELEKARDFWLFQDQKTVSGNAPARLLNGQGYP
jgi:hypothetical protein